MRLQRAWEQYRVLRGAREAGGASPRRGSPAPPLQPDPRAVSADKDHFAFTKVRFVSPRRNTRRQGD